MSNQNKEKIIQAAKTIFLRHGYKRVTMHDIASTANMSRPNLYVSFKNKAAIFKEVAKNIALKNLDSVREKTSTICSPEKQLITAFELWLIQPFELIKTTPGFEDFFNDAEDLCQEISDEIGILFEEELIVILNKIIKPNVKNIFSAKKIARILRSAAKGFKETANSTGELRQMINDLIGIIIKAISTPTSP